MLHKNKAVKDEEEATGLQQEIYHRTEDNLDPQSEADSSQVIAVWQQPLAATSPDGSRRHENSRKGIAKKKKHLREFPGGPVVSGVVKKKILKSTCWVGVFQFWWQVW